MSSIDISVITENITELLQNTVNMTSVFYDIFLNPTPMDVELKQYNSDGQLVTITLPNRAKDRQIALTGTGSPEGVVSANVGATYVDVTPNSEKVYYKGSGSGNTGWIVVLTSNGVDERMQAYLDNYASKDYVTRYLIDNNYITATSLATSLDAYRPTIPMSVIASTTTTPILLTDNTGYAITATSDITLQPPVISDLTILHKIFIQLYMPEAHTVTLGDSSIAYFNKLAPSFATAGMYNIIYEYDNAAQVWVVGSMIKGTAS